MQRIPSQTTSTQNTSDTPSPTNQQRPQPEPLEPTAGLSRRAPGRHSHATRPSYDQRVLSSFGDPGQSPSTGQGSPPLDLDAAFSTAQHVYRHSVLYHGTSATSKQSIRNEGFDTSKKSGGATGAVSNAPSSIAAEAQNHHHFSTNKNMAGYFATIGSPESPALVRTIGVQSEIGVEPDPHAAGVGLVGVRTSSHVPPNHVLRSRRQPPGPEALVFQRELAAAGVNASAQEAAFLLREVQSDSDDDFGPTPGNTA